jgi:predicted RNA binding protein YcfA (HicA-like mRNA interferase family)
VPTISEFIRLLREAGFVLREHRKKHDLWEHPTSGRRIMVPRHGGQELSAGLFHRMLRDAGLK